MKDKTKKRVLIAVGCLLCAAIIVGITVRFGGGGVNLPSGVVPDATDQSEKPDVDIDDNVPEVNIQAETSDASETDPAQGADSSGLEQTIQADPVKPGSPEKPEAPSGTTTLPDDHDGEDVPEEERKTEDEEPPSYEETPTVTTPSTSDTEGGFDQGGTYVPGFGYIPSTGEGTVTQDDSIYENGNKVGIME